MDIGILVVGEDLLPPGSAVGRDAKNVDQNIANTSGPQDRCCAQHGHAEQQLQYLPEDDAVIINPDGHWTRQK